MAAFKPLESRHRMKELLAAHFHGLDAAARDPGRRVAWCTSVGPAELLHSFGFAVYFPENHGAMLGATRTANDYIPRANATGYSPDICSYLTADVGAFLAGKTPLTGAYGLETVPRPDVLVYNTNQCRDVQDWFGFYARHFDVPLIGIQSPVQVGEVTDELVASMVPQYRALIPVLEQVSGKRFDPDRLAEVMTLSTRTTQLWEQVLATMQQRPSPLTFFDTTIHMAPAVVLRGQPEAVGYYEQLLAELAERSAQGMAAVEGERFRLYWDGMPVWGRLRELSTFFQQMRASIVVSTYCNSWVFSAFDPQQPFESMARAYLELFIARSEPAKEAIMADLCREFAVDGVIYHDAKTCPNNSNTRYGLPQRLRQRTGLPFTIVYGDLNDLRCFSEEQAKTSIEAFLEQLEAGAAA
ncbi:MAG: 2-hydroxyacyl-CoA dehydratase family protein [Deferrisomatales bacterium]|nr:2-hydroxyacyl-CoA dehydratase family protein [Deferrisomatales bacterium]